MKIRGVKHMPETPLGQHPNHQASGLFLRTLLRGGKLAYAVVVIVVTAWLSFMALRYLVVTLMFPLQAPAQIVGIPTRLDRSVLQTRRTQWQGVQANENPRVPPAHYHRVGNWARPDKNNNCTQSGCHAPLPHAKRKEVRAFLNMHATTLHCSVCHMASEATPLALTWYNLSDGRACVTPALLQAYDLLTSEDGRRRLAQPNDTVQAELAKLLAAATKASDELPALAELARHVVSVSSTSEAFLQFVEAARTTVPRYFRGGYGAKLTLRSPATGKPILGYPDTKKVVRDYLQRATGLTPPEKKDLLARVHPSIRPQTLHCLECHRASGALVDLAQVGYPPARREALVHPAVFQMIERIAGGRPMQILQVTAPPAKSVPPTSPPTPTTQPTTTTSPM